MVPTRRRISRTLAVCLRLSRLWLVCTAYPAVARCIFLFAFLLLLVLARISSLPFVCAFAPPADLYTYSSAHLLSAVLSNRLHADSASTSPPAFRSFCAASASSSASSFTSTLISGDSCCLPTVRAIFYILAACLIGRRRVPDSPCSIY
ncbi:hypothetical protein H112_01715 [Trichophyton rubrum D6]|uniref:Uncharacterized protein n=3 Tax=Trichophyton TaxID=5550 RepID=A0A080WQN1_TRIRC|nr:uncharacterized protein TERG_12539 [Trichophyton rubrum CBS 118892]XP_047607218.1 uncharacterized protein TERG_12539 [Trichophyton rubrum CBS 118892]EZF26187.1 hypothetical protein H100_01711 [Trichophyton rubrum MR850]EZF45129.1 hypothetical protein H102_01703 [Trichophyton rubrum CBS 100081]EZF55828.1 hypothetical protein H103_01717 [Trichophyton rubrum CBS 288.86]EZF66443.1 hypothetical protein H104_01692 [Trichophyton rubrum CBS 289.86]EZF77088.1 hypothetical protein H105_01719 [Tricho